MISRPSLRLFMIFLMIFIAITFTILSIVFL